MTRSDEAKALAAISAELAAVSGMLLKAAGDLAMACDRYDGVTKGIGFRADVSAMRAAAVNMQDHLRGGRLN